MTCQEFRVLYEGEGKETYTCAEMEAGGKHAVQCPECRAWVRGHMARMTPTELSLMRARAAAVNLVLSMRKRIDPELR